MLRFTPALVVTRLQCGGFGVLLFRFFMRSSPIQYLLTVRQAPAVLPEPPHPVLGCRYVDTITRRKIPKPALAKRHLDLLVPMFFALTFDTIIVLIVVAAWHC